MNNSTKQYVGIIIGAIFYFIGSILLWDIKTKIFFGIYFLSAGLLITGICAYHLKEARINDAILGADE